MPIEQGAKLLAGVTAGPDDRDLPQGEISLGGGGIHDANRLVNLTASATVETTKEGETKWSKNEGTLARRRKGAA